MRMEQMLCQTSEPSSVASLYAQESGENEGVSEGEAQSTGFVIYKQKDFQLTKQLWLKHYNTKNI